MNANLYSELVSCLCACIAQIASENDINDNVIFEPHLFIICGRTKDIFFTSDHISEREVLLYEVIGICRSWLNGILPEG